MNDTSDRPLRVQPRNRLIAWCLVGIIIVFGALTFLYFHYEKNSDATNSAQASPHSKEFDYEFGNALIEHLQIVSTILNCHKIYDQNDIPAGQWSSLNLGSPPSTNASKKIIPLSNVDLSVAYLSMVILQQRSDLADAVGKGYWPMIRWQFAIVVTGAIATILVSIRSAMKDTTIFVRFVGIFAIIFAAVSTATGSLSTFVDAQSTYQSNVRSLAELRRLHSAIATLFPFEYDASVCKSPPDAEKLKTLNASIQQWSSRLAGIEGESENSPDNGKPGKTSKNE